MSAGRGRLGRAGRAVAGAWEVTTYAASWVREHQLRSALGVAGLVAFLWAGRQPVVTGGLVAALYVVGLWLWADARAELEHPRWLAPRQLFLGLNLLPPTLLAVFALAGLPLVAVSLLAAFCLSGVLWLQAPEPEDDAWWSEEVLRGAMFNRHVLGPADGQVTLRRLGPTRIDAAGTAVRLALPGISWEALQAKRGALAAQLGLPARALLISHDVDEPENVVTLWVGVPRPADAEATRSALAAAARTSWREPVRIGVDRRGDPVLLETAEHNTLLGGKPGFGKTTTARIPLGHFLLDPSTTLLGLDGKGSRRDYGAVAPLAQRWVWGTDEDAPEQLLDMLDLALEIVRSRNAADDEPPGGWPGVLLYLEELQDVRTGGDDKQRAAIDSTLGRIIRMGRAVGVHVLVSTQRPSVNDVPSGVRNLVSQNLALVLRNGRDAELVLGTTPSLPLPTRRGEGLYATPAGLVSVELDLLDLEDWRALCERAAALRAPVAVPAAAVLSKVVTLHGAAVQLLAAGPLRSTELYEQLPEQVRPASPSAMGRALAKHPELTSRRTANGYIWSLSMTPFHAQQAASAGPAPFASSASAAAVGEAQR